MKKRKAKLVIMNKECDYGCHEKANFLFQNGKYCCSDEWFRCPVKMSERSLQRKKDWESPNTKMGSKEVLDKISVGVKNAWKNEKTRKKWKKSFKGVNKLTIDKIKKKYKLFFKRETIREKDGKLLCICKECKKEFEPTYIQLYERIRSIENNLSSNQYLFCSSICKENSDFYYRNLRGNPDKIKEFRFYSLKVHRLTRQQVKKYHNKIENIELRGFEKGYELDHKFSIYEGFIKNLPAEYIANYKNLKVIPIRKNRIKRTNSSISYQTLLSYQS